MRSLLKLVAVALALCAAVPSVPVAQMVEVKAPPADYTWTISGDTILTLSVEKSSSVSIDQSSPEECVRAFIRLALHNPANQERDNQLDAKLDEVVDRELRARMDPLVSIRLANAFKASRSESAADGAAITEWELVRDDGDSNRYRGVVWRGSRITPRESDIHLIFRPKQQVGPVETRFRSPSDPLPDEPDLEPVLYSFLCRQPAAGGDWRIAGIREYATKPPQVTHGTRIRLPYADWTDVDPGFGRLVALQTESAAFKSRTADSAISASDSVRIFFEQVAPLRVKLKRILLERVLAAHTRAIRPLLADEYVELWTEAAGPAVPALSREAIKTGTLDNGDEFVTVRTSDFYKSMWRFDVRKSADRWVIYGFHRRFLAIKVRTGEEVETFREESNLWLLMREQAESIESLGMLLRR